MNKYFWERTIRTTFLGLHLFFTYFNSPDDIKSRESRGGGRRSSLDCATNMYYRRQFSLYETFKTLHSAGHDELTEIFETKIKLPVVLEQNVNPFINLNRNGKLW